MPRTKRPNGANADIGLFAGEWQASFDCPGRCKHARFYTEPPEDGDDCAHRSSGGNCGWHPAQRVALLELRDRLSEEIEKMTVGDQT